MVRPILTGFVRPFNSPAANWKLRIPELGFDIAFDPANMLILRIVTTSNKS